MRFFEIYLLKVIEISYIYVYLVSKNFPFSHGS